jgi:arylsulfatase A-like enzyme
MQYVEALYDSEIRHADDYLRELFEQVPRSKDAVVLFTSDHGEEFFEHGGVLHGRTLYEESIRVPFILKLPGDRYAGTVVEEPVSIVDVFPTLLTLVGANVPPGLAGASLVGSDGLAVPESRIVFAELLRGSGMRAAVEAEWKFILDSGGAGNNALYDLARDPAEKRNILEENPERAARFIRIIHDFERINVQAKTEPGKTEITTEQLEALRRLGYVN